MICFEEALHLLFHEITAESAQLGVLGVVPHFTAESAQI
jgi:hypothetical protein